MVRTVLTVFMLMLISSGTKAAERFALVIGNQGYNNNVGPLRNSHKDIAVVGRALSEVGFNVLTPRKDATRDDILFDVYELAAKVGAAGRGAVSFLYYAGHGVAVGGENVLVPVNAESTTDAMLSVRGVRLSEILDVLKREAPDAVHFVVLDACRNNIRGARGSRGFVSVVDTRKGLVVAFSTAPGETATDEGANAAPYALALAEELSKPGQTDQEVFNAVRDRVVKTARGQTPWTNDGLIGKRVVFKPARAQDASAPPTGPQASEADRTLQLVKDMLKQAEMDRRDAAAAKEAADARQAALAKQAADAAAAKEAVDARQAALAKQVADAAAAKEAADARQAALAKQAADLERRKAEDDARRVAAIPPPALPPGPPPVHSYQKVELFRVLSSVSQGVHNMRSGPGVDHSLVASIPANSTGVAITMSTCRSADDGRSTQQWCRGRWRNFQGWVSMGGLTRE